MTKKELAQQIKDFLETQDNVVREELWCTNYDVAEEVLSNFAKFVGLKEVEN